MTIVAKLYNNTPAPYRFILTTGSGQVTCKPEPLEWQEGITKLKRDTIAAGVFSSFSIQSLTFTGTGGKAIKDEIMAYQMNAKITMVVEQFDQSTRSYERVPTTYKILAGSYKIVKVGDFAIGVNVEVSDTDTLTKFKEREDKKIDLTRLETLSGMTIEEFESFPLASKLRVPALEKSDNAKLAKGLHNLNDESTNEFYTFESGLNTIPGTVYNSDFAEVIADVPFQTGRPFPYNLQPFFLESTIEKELIITFKTIFIVTNRLISGNPYRLKISRVDSLLAVQETVSLLDNEGGPAEFGKREGITEIEGSHTFNLNTGDSLIFYCEMDEPGFLQKYSAFIWSSEINVKEVVAGTENAVIEGMPIGYAIARMGQLMLDKQYATYSEFFALNDLKYTATDYYTQESELRNAHLMSGLNARGLTIADDAGSINITPKLLMKEISNRWCIGYGIETIEGSERLRVENREYFFNDEVIFDLRDRINEYDVLTEILSEYAYLEIATGYKTFVYRSTNGAAEYNTNRTFTTQIAGTETLDLECEIRGDQTGFMNCLNKPVLEFGSEDIDEDGDNFIIKTQREDRETSQWRAERNEIVGEKNNSSVYGGSSLNLYLTPLRNMRRNSEIFTPALWINQSGKLRFQTSGKLSTLETEGEGYTAKENEDVPVVDLNTPYLSPFSSMVDVLFTKGEMNTLLNNGADGVPNRLKRVILTDDISGWILEVNKQNSKDMAGIKIIHKFTA